MSAESQSYIITNDEQRLKQILYNFLTNAIKYTVKGGITIRTLPIENTSFVRIEVQDTGSGIPKEL